MAGNLPGIWLESNIYDRFCEQGRSGVLYRDGRIVVNGQEVGNSANTFGRYQSYHSGPACWYRGYLRQLSLHVPLAPACPPYQ